MLFYGVGGGLRGDRRDRRLERGAVPDLVPDRRGLDGRLARARARRSCSGRTRFGYSFALCLFLAGLFTFLVRNKPEYAGAGALPLLYFIVAGVLALAVAVETYFQNERWPLLAAGAVVGATAAQPRPDGDHDAGRARATRSTRRPARRSRRSSRRSSGC